MTLYYHRERDRGTLPPKKMPSKPLAIPGLRILQGLISAVLIAFAAVIQFAGVIQGSESLLIRTFHSENSSVVMLTSEKTDGAFDPMEIAMLLRGLGKFKTERIVLNGSIREDADATPVLAGVLEGLKSQGVAISGGGPLGKERRYRSLMLCQYQPPVPLRPSTILSIVDGKTDASGTDCVQIGEGNGLLPLFAMTRDGEITGTSWWEAVSPTLSSGSCWMIANRLLFFPDHAAIRLNPGGSLPVMKGACRIMMADDFLLAIEEKERGALRPGFDTLWNDAAVLIGSKDDEGAASSVAGLRNYISFRRLPMTAQVLLPLLWIILLFIMMPLPWIVRCTTGLLLIPVIVGVTWAGISHGILLPFLPALVLALLQFIPVSRNPKDSLR